MAYTPALDPQAVGRDLNPESFSPGANGNTQQELRTFYDRPIPEMVDVLNRHRQVPGLCTLLKIMGASRGCANPTVGHYERGWKKDVVQVGNIVSGGAAAGEPIVIALDPDSMFPSIATAGGAALECSYPLEKEIIEFFDGSQARITAKNTAVSPHQLTLTPLDSGTVMNSVVANGESYMIPYNLHAEASGLPKHRIPRIITWKNSFGIIKVAFSTSGTEDTNVVRYHLEEVPGTNSINVLVEQETMESFEDARDGLFLYGQQANNLVEFSTSMGIDMNIEGTQGFIDFATTEGHQDTYLSGAYTLDDLDRVAKVYQSERISADENVLVWQGPDVFFEVENSFQQMFVQNLSPFLRRMIPDMAPWANNGEAGGPDQDAALQYIFGISAVHKGGFNFGFKLMPGFADPKGAGAEGYRYRSMQIFHPVNYVSDRKTGKKIRCISYEYKQSGKYNREMVIGEVNGVGTNTTPWAANEFDVRQKGILGELAGHFALSNQIVVQTAN